ncbi:MAG: adenylate/guanylate cyclase domain-containing protein [Myxococcaceae bacterium]
MATDADLDLTLAELKALRTLSRAVDDALEESLKSRDNLDSTFARLFPVVLQQTGARGVVVTTQNEELATQTWAHGDFGGTFAGAYFESHPFGTRRIAQETWVSQALDLVGVKVGSIGLLYEGDRSGDAGPLGRALETIAEQLDTVLAQVHTASEKHQVILKLNQLLANRVFETGMDQAVLAMAERVRLPGLMLVYRDAVRPGLLHYRGYRFGRLEYESGARPFPALEEQIRAHGTALIAPGDERLRKVWGAQRTVEAVLIAGLTTGDALGKIFVWSEREGFSAYTLDLIRVLASTLSQRLVDYNRERIHLSQFFAPDVIDELLTDPQYEAHFLTPRDEEVGILFADINGFTRICEQVLEAPSRIGRFVDRWSDGVVELLWKHGGVFDKMVGDCVIGLFGPPFFKSTPLQRVESLVRCAREIQDFTRAMSADPEVSSIAERVKLPGLGVAIGVNLANAFCGLFGPNSSYTGFSTGMNQTARLQSLGGFRETLVMAPVRKVLEGSSDPKLKSLSYGPLTETPVKNVAQPLSYFSLK